MRPIEDILRLQEREELLNELQSLTGWPREQLVRAAAGRHNEQIRYVLERIKREG